jgi:uncharacterized membrane protein
LKSDGRDHYEKRESPKPFVPSSKPETDLEKFIGENLLSKIGITVLVLGISFFVKYAIDQNWIKEGGRVIIGLIAGGILIGIAHRIRNSYRSFSSVLMGGGLTVFYFTIALHFINTILSAKRRDLLSWLSSLRLQCSCLFITIGWN